MADLGIGTAFPGSPNLGDWFTRSDLGGTQFVYENGSWLAVNGAGEGASLRIDENGGMTVAIAAGKVANTIVKAAPGKLIRIAITSVGTNALAVYDSDSAAAGTLLAYIQASAPVGNEDVEMPAALGIVVAGNANNPGVTIAFE